ncbi:MULTISPECIES: type II toxin-antitoxin system VapC family toxin [unclassified Endozoicomonas]|uniref:type II toxin-antitoxin system VapC family toxin n=1 Tax=unclassified Endozoicomonas TaxID=2644528 RepID=UPI003BB7EC10
MVLIDTHIAVFLHSGDLGKVSPQAQEQLEHHDIVLPELARLELQYLHEIGRIAYTPAEIVADLYGDVGMVCSKTPTAGLVQSAMGIHWTRDVFDRLIAADAIFCDCPLITRDQRIIEHLPQAFSARY